MNEAREAISGDVQLARRLEEFPLLRWSAEEAFEQLLPGHHPQFTASPAESVLSARAARRILQISAGITARVFRMLNELAVDAIEIWRRAYN